MGQKLRIIFTVAFFLVGCSCQQEVSSAGSSAGSNGREFIFAIPSYFTNPGKMIANLSIIGMSREESHVQIHVTGLNYREDVEVRYQQAAVVELPLNAVASLDSNYANTVCVVATNDVTVRCIMGYRSGNHPGDGFLVLPTPALDMEYIIATVLPSEEANFNAQFTVSAAHENTSIDIVSKLPLTVFKETFIPLEVVRLSLDRHQSIVIRAQDDLTGTRVTATRAVAVVSGNDCATIPAVRTMASCYYLVEQLMPTSTWGKEFFVYPFQRYAMTHVVRVILMDYEKYELVFENDVANQVVTVQGETSNYDYIISGQHVMKISSYRPIMVIRYVEYINRVNLSLRSSGAMMVVPPQEQLNRRASVVMPLPKQMVQQRELIFPKLSVCIIISCSYVDALLVNGIPRNPLVRVQVIRPADLHTCAIETQVSAPFGDVITFSSSSPSARMQVTVRGYFGGYLNFLYTASQRFEKLSRNSTRRKQDEHASTQLSVAQSTTAEEAFTTYVTQGIKFSTGHYAYVAGGGVLCLLAVACLIFFAYKCLCRRSNRSLDQPIKEISSPTRMGSQTDYEEINIEMCTFERTPSAMTTTSDKEAVYQLPLPRKSRLRRMPSKIRQPSGRQFNLDNGTKRVKCEDCPDPTSVVSPKSCEPDCYEDYGYIKQSLPEGDYHDYIPMAKAQSSKYP